MARNLEEAEKIISLYEGDGVAKLFFSLNRKASEMADMLNSINLKNVPLDDPKDKTFERLRFMINDSSSIAGAVKSLGDASGMTGQSEKDIDNKKFQIITAESMSNVLSSQ